MHSVKIVLSVGLSTLSLHFNRCKRWQSCHLLIGRAPAMRGRPSTHTGVLTVRWHATVGSVTSSRTLRGA